MARRTRGEQRFAAVTYSLLSEWTGLTLSTIRTYGAQGLIPRDNLSAVIAWANARRAKRGLPPIGEHQDEAEPDENTTTTLPPPPITSAYNPLTGEFSE